MGRQTQARAMKSSQTEGLPLIMGGALLKRQPTLYDIMGLTGFVIKELEVAEKI